MSAQAVLSTPQQTGRTGADSPTAAGGRKKMQIAGRWDLKPPEFSRDLKAEDQKKENQRALEHFRFSFDIHQKSTALVLGYDEATAGPAEQKMWNLQIKQALTQYGMKNAEFFTVVKNALQKPGAMYKDGLVALEKHFGHDAISMLVTAVFALIDFAGNKVAEPQKRLLLFNKVMADVQSSNYTPDGFFQLLLVVRGLKKKHREVIYTKMKERYNSTGGTLPTLEDLRGDIESLGTAQQIAKSDNSEQTQDGHEFGSRAERKGRGPKGLTFAGGTSRGGGSGPCFTCGIFGHRADKCMLTEEEIAEKKEMDKKFVKALFEKRKADKKEKESVSAARASTAGHTPAQKSKKKENAAAALRRVEDSDSDAFTDDSYDSDATYF